MKTMDQDTKTRLPVHRAKRRVSKAAGGICTMTINDLLRQYPRATSVFIKRMMLCIGCPAAEFHTLEDAAMLYGFPLGDLSHEIETAIAEGM